jgi:CRISPR/Cas system CSM-associated protein Csm2 small subunit
MGWSGGSEHAEALINACLEVLEDNEKARAKIYYAMIKIWCQEDWDTENEIEGLDEVFDDMLKKYYKEIGYVPDDDE